MIQTFKSLNLFRGLEFKGIPEELILSYYIPQELERVPSLKHCLTNYDLMQAYLFKRKFFKHDFSIKMDSEYIKLLFNVNSVSKDLFEYEQPSNTCPIIDRYISEYKDEIENDIHVLESDIEMKENQISELENQTEDLIDASDDEEDIKYYEEVLKNESESLQAEIEELQEELDDNQNTLDIHVDTLESIRSSCENVREQGLAFRDNFFEFIEEIIIDKGQIICPDDYQNHFKEEKFTEYDSYSYDYQDYSEALDNLELIESWANQWTNPDYLKPFFENLEVVIREEKPINNLALFLKALKKFRITLKTNT